MLGIFDIFEIKKDSFSENDMLIYNTIINYPGIIERYTISQLAEFLNISTTAIMRFAKKLGYSGYSQLRFEYMKSSHIDQASDNNAMQYVKMITESFNRFSEIDQNVYTDLAREIKTHKSVCALGIGKSGLVAEYMRYSFLRCGKSINIATDTVTINDIPKVSTSKDLFFYFSEKGASVASTTIKNFLKNSAASKAKIVIITCNPNITYDESVYRTVVIPNVDYQKEGIRSHSLMIGFVDILISYYMQNL